MDKTPGPEPIPQFSRPDLKHCLRAVLQVHPERSLKEWMTREGLSPSRQKHVKSALKLAGLLMDPDHLAEEVSDLSRSESLADDLIDRFRQGYAGLGCRPTVTRQIGSDLPNDALRTMLAGERPFRDAEEDGTRNNGTKTAEHVHRLRDVLQEVRGETGNEQGTSPATHRTEDTRKEEEDSTAGVPPTLGIPNMGLACSLEYTRDGGVVFHFRADLQKFLEEAERHRVVAGRGGGEKRP